MRLRDILPDDIYEGQKELFKRIIDGGKKVLKKEAENIYIIQKDVLKKAQEELIEDATEAVADTLEIKALIIHDKIKSKIPFIGKYLADIVYKYLVDLIKDLRGE